jgi:sucrose-6-phosphate hydrolase SacC (GH32 family)
MSNKRKLTLEERQQLMDSANICKSNSYRTGYVNGFYQDAYSFDFNQDTSFRLIDNGFTYYEVVTMNTLHSVLVPVNAHICNVIGNMNYTNAYKNINS